MLLNELLVNALPDDPRQAYSFVAKQHPGDTRTIQLRVTVVDYVNMKVSLAAPNDTKVGFDTDRDPNKPFLLRRWDYQGTNDPNAKNATTLASDGALKIVENHWLTLENGILQTPSKT